MSSFSRHAVVTRVVDVPAAAAWNVLPDGWLYGTGVVGASRIRAVGNDWPREGSRIHHSGGLWPAGEATVWIDLDPRDDGRTAISMAEDVVAGPARIVRQPVRQLLMTPRNRETLLRLSLLAHGRATQLSAPEPPTLEIR